MPFQESTYAGDADYSINATGDCCVGDEVAFERAVFSGSFRNARFSHFERVVGEIVADSYGADKQQHTFSLRLPDGTTTRIKGRNLYREGVWRKPWGDELLRDEVLKDKHSRGDAARAARDIRKGASA